MSEDETADILPVILGTRAAKLFVDANSFDIISDDTMKKVKDCGQYGLVHSLFSKVVMHIP
jgi:hypothetical protein